MKNAIHIIPEDGGTFDLRMGDKTTRSLDPNEVIGAVAALVLDVEKHVVHKWFRTEEEWARWDAKLERLRLEKITTGLHNKLNN